MPDRRRLLTLVAVSTAIRTAAAAGPPLLAAEAYYWLWNVHPAWGYVDHPPMTGWLAHVCFGWVRGVELAARSGAILMGALTILAVHGLARALFPAGGTPWRAALLYAVTPVFAGLGVVLQPDGPLLLFMALTWWTLWLAAERGGLGRWVLAGVCAGAALLSKFHAWVLLPPLIGFLVLSPRRRGLLRTAGPWAAVATALLVLSPNLAWNAQHDWVNYAFQWRRSAIEKAEPTSIWVHLFVIGAVVALSPGVLWAMARAVVAGLRRARTDDRVLFLLCAGLPLPLFLGLLSFGVKISVHWPSAGYVPLLVLAAFLAEPTSEPASPQSSEPASGDGAVAVRAPRVLPIPRWAWGFAVATTLTLLALPIVAPRLAAMGDDTDDPADAAGDAGDAGDESTGPINSERLSSSTVGWRELADVVRAEHAELSREGPAVVFAAKWSTAAMIAFYSGLTHDCFALVGGHAVSFEVWRRERGGLAGTSAVVVVEAYDPDTDEGTIRPAVRRRRLRPLFDTIERRPSLVVYADGSATRVPNPGGEPGGDSRHSPPPGPGADAPDEPEDDDARAAGERTPAGVRVRRRPSAIPRAPGEPPRARRFDVYWCRGFRGEIFTE